MILKAMFWQLMDRDNRIRIPHPLPKRKATPYGVAFLFASGFGMEFEPIRCNGTGFVKDIFHFFKIIF